MSDLVARFDGSTLTGALNRDAAALNNTAKATNDTAHNLAAEQTIAGRSRNTFQDIYYSHMGGEAAGYVENDVRYYIRGAGAPVDSQIGTHLSLLGDSSFFRVQDPSDQNTQYFTRVGTFNYNAKNEVENHFGMKLLYVPAVNGVLPTEAPQQLTTVLDCSDSRMHSNSQSTSEITFRCGLNGAVGDSVTRAITVYDSTGTPRTLNYVFTRQADWTTDKQAWNLKIQAPNASAVVGAYGDDSPVVIQFDADGCPEHFVNSMTTSVTPPRLNVTCPGGNLSNVMMNLGSIGEPDGVIRITGGQSRLQVQVNGHRDGFFRSLDISDDGKIYANYDNGQRELVGRLAVGTFNNPDGLEMLDRSLYLENSKRSGPAKYMYIGDHQAGKVAVGALEGSTVEIIPNMAKMIERQHVFNNITSSYGTKKQMLDKISNLRNS